MPAAADEVCEVIITAPDPDWLVEFTRRLVTDRLCASGHNSQPIRYEVPSVVAVPIIDGGSDYIGWILEQTEQPA